MNICWFSHYFMPEIGAPSARLNDLSKCWITDGHRVQINTCFPNHPTGQLYPGYISSRYMCEKLDKIQVHRHWTYIAPNSGILKKTIGHLSLWASSTYWNKKYIQQQHPDVIIGTSPTPFAAWSGALAAKRLQRPFIMEVRDLWPEIFMELGILKNPFIIKLLEIYIDYLYRNADAIVTVTESFRRAIIDRGFNPEKITTIPNGADTDFWDVNHAKTAVCLKKDLGLNNKFIVLYIGAHGISHALARILDSAAMLKAEKKIHFLFVGDGAEKNRLIKKAGRNGMTNVTFLDPTDKNGVRDFYAMADICLVPLRNIPLFETFIPSKMFEIMSMQRPIVASVAGEAAEILKKSKGAIVVPPENSKQICNSILTLYQNFNSRKQMGENGRKFVTSKYTRNFLSKQYLLVLKQAMKRRRLSELRSK